MLLNLLSKDLRRARRNPVPYLVHLSVPLVITALLGLVFGGLSSRPDSLGRIKVAVVDEDDSPLTGFLRGALNQGEGAKHLEPVFLPRAEALRQVTNGTVSAALIIPTNFTRNYLLSTNQVALELVKNPAEAFYPAILEELLQVAATAMNGLKRNAQAGFGDWAEVALGNHRPSLREISELLGRSADRFDVLRHRVDPLPIWLDHDERASKPATPGDSGQPSMLSNMFAFLLPGLAAMFLLFLADVAMRDLAREVQARTFQRYCTLPPAPELFIASKVIFTVVMALIGTAILLGGGGLVFQIHWARPLLVTLMALSYAVFAAGLVTVLAGLTPSGRAVDVVNNMVLILLGLASGSAFPSNALPDLMRLHITPNLPPAWFIEAMRGVQFGGPNGNLWITASVKLAVLGLLLTFLSAWLFRRKLRSNSLA